MVARVGGTCTHLTMVSTGRHTNIFLSANLACVAVNMPPVPTKSTAGVKLIGIAERAMTAEPKALEP
jgi:hypothetical protein